MDQPYIGLISLFSFNFMPPGWLPCNGQQLGIKENQALFSLIGTIYGGDGTSSFNLPNLNSRVPIGQGSSPELDKAIAMAEIGGAESAALEIATMPEHSHPMFAAKLATSNDPNGRLPAPSLDSLGADVMMYGTGGDSGLLPTSTAGNGVPFNIRNPYLGVQYCIAVQGFFPSFDN